eukprot:4380308-Prymnesium_polylepis.1
MRPHLTRLGRYAPRSCGAAASKLRAPLQGAVGRPCSGIIRCLPKRPRRPPAPRARSPSEPTAAAPRGAGRASPAGSPAGHRCSTRPRRRCCAPTAASARGADWPCRSRRTRTGSQPCSHAPAAWAAHARGMKRGAALPGRRAPCSAAAP